MINSGNIGMPLHFGKMPKWLTERMGKMGSAVIESVAQNYGKSEVLSRLSNPNWFQALGAVMGMQWNSSGVTATVLGSLKRKINPMANELGIYILGGKGKYSWRAPEQIKRLSDKHGLKGNELVHSCQLTRRVDNNAIQDGYNLYQQYFVLSDEGEWTAITQGMNTNTRRARRYHWHSPSVRSFVDDPHKGIVGMQTGKILNLADKQADFARKNIVSLTREKPKEVLDVYKGIAFPNRHDVRESDVNMTRLASVLNMAYNSEINNFEDLLMLKGIGPRTIKSLALVSEVIHGNPSRFDDPARFSFAVGGKDGVPHPVDTETYDETIELLQDAVEKAKLGYNDKSKALKRLHNATVKNEKSISTLSIFEDMIDFEWKHAEKKGGKTILGDTVKGVTRALVAIQNAAIYGSKKDKN